jgi:hypothetical protein
VKKRLVTSLDLETRTVTIDVPHGELLANAGASLGHWQEQVDRLKGELAELQEAGIFLDEADNPLVPGWWERKENGHHIAWYLVWPAKYARSEHAKIAGRKRRQYVKESDYEATKAQVQRTLEYANLKSRHDTLARNIEQAGRDLAKLVEKYEW